MLWEDLKYIIRRINPTLLYLVADYRISRYFVPLGFMYPPPQNYVFFRTTRLQNECQYLILWQENPGISLKRQVIWIPHVESHLWMYTSNHQKTSLNLHFPLFELSARCPFFTDSLYPSDIFDELVVGFLHPSVYIWGVQNTEKYGSTAVQVDLLVGICHTVLGTM